MATTVHQPPRIGVKEPSPLKAGSGNGGGLVPGPPGRLTVREYASPPTSTAIWVVMAAISMTFLAFTSALIVRKGGAQDWRHLAVPTILYFNTLVLLASSVTLQVARQRITTFMQAGAVAVEDPARWLYVTLTLGLVFVAGQYIAWRQLNAQGLYLASNPSSSFFYVFTAAHALHLLGGLAALLRVIHKLNNATLRRNTLIATARYWHFMDFLWVYLFVLLGMTL
jgi:cytochrome c oxidase subunit III